MNGTFYTHSVDEVNPDVNRQEGGTYVLGFDIKMRRPGYGEGDDDFTDIGNISLFMTGPKAMQDAARKLRDIASEIETLLMQNNDYESPEPTVIPLDPGMHGC